MELDLDTKHLLADLLAKPEKVLSSHANILNQLILKYPYYQPLHLLLAKANVNKSNAIAANTKASFYNNGNLLHRIIYHPETFKLNGQNIANKELAVNNEEIDEEQVFEEISEVNINSIESEDTATLDEQQVFNEIVEVDVTDFPLNIIDEEGVADKVEPKIFDDQAIFNEIVEVDATEFPKNLEDEAVEEEDLIIENIAATDFFAFEETIKTEKPVETVNHILNNTQPEEYDLDAEAQTVSKYDDDKLPFTFLWWLAKTRKEHEQIFQPYVTQKKQETPQSGELHQQYVEHIFHIQSPFKEVQENSKNTINRKIISRGTDIIDSFIKNDPQIKAPKAEQINTENKAKQSAEDQNDLVSETLAAIYIEQMLYHKAIDTYEKLSLKFPEKSRYFADLIQSLEKKI